MSVQNFRREQRLARRYVEKTASATLTADELEFGFIAGNHASNTVALTLPAADASMKGYDSLIVCKGAANTTVTVSGGFGGGGAGQDTVTLAQGEKCQVFCDGEKWYVLHHTAPA